jgi:tRNA modification GTPase
MDGIQPLQESSVIVTNSRHYAALLEAKSSLEKSMETLKANQSGEFITVDLRAALDFLGEIGGVKTTDDILNRVFSSFCIGK